MIVPMRGKSISIFPWKITPAWWGLEGEIPHDIFTWMMRCIFFKIPEIWMFETHLGKICFFWGGEWVEWDVWHIYFYVHLYSQPLTPPQSAPRLVIGSLKFHHVWLVSEGLQTFWKASKWQKKEWMSELQLGDLNYIWNAPQPGEGHKTKASKNHDSLPEYCASESLGPMMMKDMTRTLSTLQKNTNPSIALLGGGVFFFLFSRLYLGKIPILTYLSKVLKPPTSLDLHTCGWNPFVFA